MQAPSEKHLEDYLWEHPEALCCHYSDGELVPSFIPLFRQFLIPNGIPDLIGVWGSYHLGVLELKQGAIDTKALAQVLRYMHDFHSLLWSALVDVHLSDSPYNDPDFLDPAAFGDLHNILLRGVLIGYSAPDENLLIACAACNVEVVLYNYDGEQYTFVGAKCPTVGKVSLDIHMCPELGNLMARLLENHFETYRLLAHNRNFKADIAAEDYLSTLDATAGGE